MINPYLNIVTDCIKVTEDNIFSLFKDEDIICEAFDVPENKAMLVNKVLELFPEKYIISGIYQCANDRGANIRMSREGYDQIGEETANMWCMHYFLQDVSKQSFIVQTLENNYGGNVYLHENSWPGLYGILSAM